MPKPFPAAQLEASILRYLLTQGQPCDFTEIRFGAEGLGSVPRRHLWAAIRALIERCQVSYAYRVERTVYEGFEQTLTFPVFWVNRDNIVRDQPATAPRSAWWPSFLAPLGGEGVHP